MNQRLSPDPTGYRVGVAPATEVGDKMKQVAKEARAYIDYKKVKERKNLEEKELEELVSLMRGAVMIAYPGYHGLPDWDYVCLILEDKLDFPSMWPDVEVVLV